MKRWSVQALFAIGVVVTALACGNDDEGDKGLPGNTACEKWQSLSLRAECDFPQTCPINPACSKTAITWMECTYQDITQCRCEMNLQLSCEGSHDPNEGPALCGTEWRAYNECALANQ